MVSGLLHFMHTVKTRILEKNERRAIANTAEKIQTNPQRIVNNGHDHKKQNPSSKPTVSHFAFHVRVLTDQNRPKRRQKKSNPWEYKH